MERARLTPIDVVFYGAAIFVLAALAAPMYTILQANAGELGPAAGLLFQMPFPGLVMTILIVIYLTGAAGGGGIK